MEAICENLEIDNLIFNSNQVVIKTMDKVLNKKK